MSVQFEDPCGKKEAVLNSTLALIKEHGFHGTPMSQIAKHAGVAAGTIYHYFESKDALIIELYIDIKNKLAVAIMEGYDESRSYKDRFFTMLTNQYNYYVKNQNALFFLEQYTNSPYAKNFPEKDSEVFVNKIHTFFNYGMENAYFKNIDSRLLAPTIKGTLVAAANFQLSEHMAFTKDDITEVINIIWDGIKKQ